MSKYIIVKVLNPLPSDGKENEWPSLIGRIVTVYKGILEDCVRFTDEEMKEASLRLGYGAADGWFVRRFKLIPVPDNAV